MLTQNVNLIFSPRLSALTANLNITSSFLFPFPSLLLFLASPSLLSSLSSSSSPFIPCSYDPLPFVTLFLSFTFPSPSSLPASFQPFYATLSLALPPSNLTHAFPLDIYPSLRSFPSPSLTSSSAHQPLILAAPLPPSPLPPLCFLFPIPLPFIRPSCLPLFGNKLP